VSRKTRCAKSPNIQHEVATRVEYYTHARLFFLKFQ